MRFFITTILIITCLSVFSQNNRSRIIDADNNPAAFANVAILSTDSTLISGTSADADGWFLVTLPSGKFILSVSCVGYKNYSVECENGLPAEIVLQKQDVDIEEVDVTAQAQGQYISRIDVRQVESINRTGLTKLACCTLSESFENSGTTGTSYSDAITGTKQIQMLGLSGVYIQTLGENIPIFRGLDYLFGWNYTPAAWLKSIQISKGAASVTSGYESVTGQINLTFASPAEGRKTYIDFYTDEYLMTDVNIVIKSHLNEKWRFATFAHTTMSLMPDDAEDRHDRNHDGFADMPKVQSVNFQSRWIYLSDNGLQSRFVLSAATEKRKAGQMKMDNMQHELFKTECKNTHLQISNKTGFPFGDKEGQSIGIISNLTTHGTYIEAGKKSLEADELYFYSNLILNSYLFNDNHKYAIGASYIYNGISNSYTDSLPKNFTPKTKFNKTENVTGIFVELNDYSVKNLIITAGIRADYNSRYKWLITPRFNLKYTPADFLTIRATAGKGYRSANPLSENIGLFSTSRQLYAHNIPQLDIEEAWNYGGNIIFSIPSKTDDVVLSLDFYRTDFKNRVITDIERDKHCAFFYNLHGHSHAYAAQADLSATIFEGMTFYSAFRYNIQHIDYSEHNQNYDFEMPLLNQYKSLINIAYATNMRKWIFDATLQLNGKCRLPNMNGYSENERYSDAYTLIFAQITKRFKYVETYIGVENLTDYRQKNPIIESENPFGDNFDASIVYAPIVGRKIYFGLRFNFGKFMD